MIFDMTKRKGGGDLYEIARQMVDRTLTEYRDPTVTTIGSYAFYALASLKTVFCENATVCRGNAFGGTGTNLCGVETVVLPKLQYSAYPGLNNAFSASKHLKQVDLGAGVKYIGQGCFSSASACEVIIFRSSSLVQIHSTSVFNGSSIASGGNGCTIYIPKSLYDHLGDGTSLDYKAATNWSTYDAYGTITWAKIEGSIYETQYADGTPIPTA